MEGITSSLLLYSIFLFLALISGIIYWVMGKFKTGAVFSIIFSLLGPVIVIFLAAQRDQVITVYEFITAEMSAGNSLARVTMFIHIYLLVWVLFIIGFIIFKLVFSNNLREKTKQLFTKKQSADKENED